MSGDHWFLTLPKSERDKRLRKLLESKPRSKRSPTSEALIRRLASQGNTATVEEVRDDQNSMTADDYDEWVWQCVHDVYIGRIQVGEDPEKVEHPHERLHRLGALSINEGKPSQLCLFLVEKIQSGAKLPDLKHPNEAMKVAQRRLNIAIEFKKFLSAYLANPPLLVKKISNFKMGESSAHRISKISLQDAKRRFKLAHQEYTPRQIALALKEYHLDFHAYAVASPRKGRRKNISV